ncbi:uncharacterized protein N0V96_009611 [Colletotrichum fioriniae]|uniref:uncharacterized protein n=1 Tax=Colletotrichum fioriniae TaxID=710243 RepID=UPI0032D9CA29|nr:hypothetical protein N0V96_009611 [Colletotrichum fioriniae]
MTRRKKRTTKAENFVYNHDELVSLIKKHYQLLIDMAYFEPEDVRWPPEPAGWSAEDLNVNALQILGRDIKVIQLLRHIPYPRKKNTEPPEVDEQQMWWLKAKALSFKEFFDKIRTQMSTLTLVPAPAVGDLGKSIMHSGDSGSEGIKQLYYECGWPGPLRKEEFLQKVVPVREAGIQEISHRYDEFHKS